MGHPACWLLPQQLLIAPTAHVPAHMHTSPSYTCRPHAALPADTSWQHKPLRKLHSARAHRGPADIAAAAAGPETSGASGEGSEGAAAGMAPATMLLARTYSGPPGSAAKASRTSTLSRRGVEALQRVSFDGGMSVRCRGGRVHLLFCLHACSTHARAPAAYHRVCS